MKVNRSFLLLTFLFCSCGNSFFREVTGVYEASFETNGGTPIASFETIKIEKTPETNKEDYNFDGWYKQEELLDKVDFPYTLTENTRFYAKWLRTYLVSFETNGGSSISSFKTSRLETSPVSTKENCILEGWYTAADFSGDAVVFPYEVNKDVIFYAKWSKTYNVSFEVNGGSSISSYRTSKIDDLPISNKDDYSLIGWYFDPGFTKKVEFPVVLNTDIVLHAKWQKKYLVKFDTQGGNQLSETYTGYLEETEIPVKEYKDFSGWYLGPECEESQQVMLPFIVESEVTLYAKWNNQQCLITYMPNGATSGTVPVKVNVEKGSLYSISANSGNLVKPGYAFTKWNTESDGKGTSFLAGQIITVTRDLVLYAQWGKDYAALLHVDGGTFNMGKSNTSNAKPIHSVTVGNFYLAQYELTYELWYEVYSWAIKNGYSIDIARKGSSQNGSTIRSDFEPAMDISWCNAVVWCNAYSQYKGLRPCYYTDSQFTEVYKVGSDFLLDIYWDETSEGYRLPTEAEWEYAAGGGSENRTEYSGTSSSSLLSEYAWISGKSDWKTHPVGMLKPNGLGFYDMTGNANEWCFSTMYAYSSDPLTNPRKIKIYPYTNYDYDYEHLVVARGGSYHTYNIYDIQYRVSTKKGTTSLQTGIRIAKNMD